MLSTGHKAPDFVLPDLTGGSLSLSELSRTGSVLLTFFKVSCPVCQYTFPFLERLKNGDGLNIVGISQDDDDATAEFCRSYGISMPMLLDSDTSNYPVSNAYRITHVPSLFLIEGETIATAVSGFSRADLQAIGERFGTPAFKEGEKTPEFRPG